uniref:C2 domain-containing protein n=1 Tax=Ficedula albicollis TaxID=59894 RepID=A0A803W237_FICAL
MRGGINECERKRAGPGLYFLFLLLGLPDPFAKVVVDGSGQCHSTDTVKNTLDPKWNQHYDL